MRKISYGVQLRMFREFRGSSKPFICPFPAYGLVQSPISNFPYDFVRYLLSESVRTRHLNNLIGSPRTRTGCQMWFIFVRNVFSITVMVRHHIVSYRIDKPDAQRM